MKTCCAMLVRSVMVALIAGTVLAVMPGQALAGNIYDSQVLQRIKFAPALRRKVRAVLRQSDREMAAIFRKYGINPNAKPVFSKLRTASSELQNLESREKRKMKKIMSAEQYKAYLELLQETAARVIKATRTKP